MFSENARPKLAFAITFGLLALAGCPGTLDLTPFHDAATIDDAATETGSGGEAGACPDVPVEILTPQCAKAGCHTGPAPAGNVDLSITGIATLPGKSDPACGGLIVDSTNAEKSVLYLKLSATPPCGARMPFGSAPLSDSDQQCVLGWIRTLPAKGFSLDATAE